LFRYLRTKIARENSGPHSSISGGSLNAAGGWYSSVSGGQRNTASGESSSVSGGATNTASGGWRISQRWESQHCQRRSSIHQRWSKQHRYCQLGVSQRWEYAYSRCRLLHHRRRNWDRLRTIGCKFNQQGRQSAGGPFLYRNRKPQRGTMAVVQGGTPLSVSCLMLIDLYVGDLP